MMPIKIHTLFFLVPVSHTTEPLFFPPSYFQTDQVKEMKKMRYGAKLEAYNGVWYPYQSCATTSVQSIRTLDSIKVTAISNNGVEGMHETFWVRVVAVTPRGDIVGYSQNDLYHYPIATGNYIVCQIKNVMFASKGPHWKDVPYGTIIGDPCDNPTCHEWEMGEEKFKRCSRCQQVIYCRPECQRAHWLSGHRQVCKKSETNSRGTHDDDGNNNNPNAPMSGGGSIANQKCSCCNTKFSDDVCSSNIVAEREAVASAAAVQASLVEQLQQGWLMSEKEATAWIAQERQQKQQKAAAAAAEATAAAEKAAHEAAVLLAQEQPEQEAAAAAVQRQQQLEVEAAEAVAAERAAHTATVFAKEQQDKQEATAAAADGE